MNVSGVAVIGNDKVGQHCREGFVILKQLGQEAEACCSMDEDPDFVVLDFEPDRQQRVVKQPSNVEDVAISCHDC